MKKVIRRIFNRFKRLWVWSRMNKLQDTLSGEIHEPADDITKQLILIYKNLLKESHTHLYKVHNDYDTFYEIHDNTNKIYISLLHKSNCSELHLMKFPHKNRSLSEYKVIINSHVSDRLIQSTLHEMQLRTQSLHESFEKIKNNNLEEISKTYENE